MSDLRARIQHIVDYTGWDADDVLGFVLDYVERQQDDDALVQYLLDEADEETGLT